MVASPYCQDDLVLECDVTASSARDVSTLPGNVLLSDDSIWAPAHRTGPNWVNYVQFFFRNFTLLKEVTLESTTSPRPAVAVRISKDGVAWSNSVLDETSLGVFRIVSEELTVRYARVEFDGPVEVSRISWKGCDRGGETKTCPSTESTPLSTNSTVYRHVSYDPALLKLYFCDAKPTSVGLACFTHDPSTGVITALPHYVSRIDGYSPSDLRTYLNDNLGALISSEDGVKMTLVDQSSMPGDLLPATVVPGLEALTTVTAGGGYSADFDGLLLNGERIIAWSSCCS